MTAVESSLGHPRIDARDGRPRILFIASVGRSGSTLIERMLGQVGDCCSVGELAHIWQRGVVEDQRCGCGVAFSACPFWLAVGEEAFGGWDSIGDRGERWKRRVDRHRYIPFMTAPWMSSSYTERRRRFAPILERLYRAIATVSGASVVVDGSKSSSYLFLLRGMSGVDLRMLHLTRDARGVAYSATKRVRRPEITSGVEYMPTSPPLRTGLDWVVYNTLYEMLRAGGVPNLHLRYEDLIDHPRWSLARVLELVEIGATANDLSFIDDRVARLDVTHTISGNPMRFESGDVPLRLDEAWRERLSPRDRFGVETLTWPLMRRYGYRG